MLDAPCPRHDNQPTYCVLIVSTVLQKEQVIPFMTRYKILLLKKCYKKCEINQNYGQLSEDYFRSYIHFGRDRGLTKTPDVFSEKTTTENIKLKFLKGSSGKVLC